MPSKTLAAILAIVVAGSAACAGTTATVQLDDAFACGSVREIMKRTFDYQTALQAKTKPSNGWIRATFYTGVIAAYNATKDPAYLDRATSWSEEFEYTPRGDYRFGNDQLAAQTYLDIYMLKREPRMLQPIRGWFDAMMREPRPGRVDWWWCDGLYMGPPVLARVAAATGQRKYLAYLDKMYWDAYECLYDKREHLFSRDITMLESRTPNGRKMFWSRGNGWVLAGLANMIPYLPEDWAPRARFVALFKEMSAKIVQLQGSDGMWRTALLDPDSFPVGETSGTGFYTYALAWGINSGILDRAAYEPAVRKGWAALVRSVNAEGRLGYVQMVGDKPGDVREDQTHEYGVGAFLLAGSEMLKLRPLQENSANIQ